MSPQRPDDQPTTVIPQQTAEQPAVTTSPPADRNRVWQRKLPAHLGRARTSTVVIGALFLLLGGLNTVLPTDPYVDVPTADGGTVRVRSSQYTPPATSTPSTTAPATTSEEPRPTSASPTTTARTTAPRSTTSDPGDDEQSPAPETTEEQETTERSTSSSAPTSTRAPATTADGTSAAPTS